MAVRGRRSALAACGAAAAGGRPGRVHLRAAGASLTTQKNARKTRLDDTHSACLASGKRKDATRNNAGDILAEPRLLAVPTALLWRGRARPAVGRSAGRLCARHAHPRCRPPAERIAGRSDGPGRWSPEASGTLCPHAGGRHRGRGIHRRSHGQAPACRGCRRRCHRPGSLAGEPARRCRRRSCVTTSGTSGASRSGFAALTRSCTRPGHAGWGSPRRGGPRRRSRRSARPPGRSTRRRRPASIGVDERPRKPIGDPIARAQRNPARSPRRSNGAIRFLE